MNWRTFIVLLLVFTKPSLGNDLEKEFLKIVNDPVYKHARWGYLVVDAESGRTIIERNADQFFVPASVTKLFTCATALQTLGPDYRFTTPIVHTGEIKEGVLWGDLILVASGDLTFGGRRGKDGKILYTDIDHTYAAGGFPPATWTDSDPYYALKELVKQIKEKGIKQIMGEIYIDDRLFMKSQSTGSGPLLVTPMILNDNVIDIRVLPGKKAGEPAKVETRPVVPVVTFDSRVTTGEKGKPTNVYMDATAINEIFVRGTIAEGSHPIVRIFVPDDPNLITRCALIQCLREAQIKVEAPLLRQKQYNLPDRNKVLQLPVLAKYESEPLAESIKVCLKVSHNLYASTLPALVALKMGGSTVEEGLRHQAKVLKELKVDPDGVAFGGGAGGNIVDRATPRACVEILQAMAKTESAKSYFDGLAILGIDGTLATTIDEKSPAKGKVRAKTGTLGWYDTQNSRFLVRSKSLAGELTTEKGRKLYFAILLNDLPLSGDMTIEQQGQVIGKLCEILHLHADRALESPQGK